MATLYQLTAEYMTLLEMAEDPEVDLQALTDTMEAIGGELEDKADGYAKVIRQMEYDEAAIDAEIKRLMSRKKTIFSNIERLKDNLQMAMTATGKTKFKTALHSFNIQKNPPSVVMDELYVENIPEVFLIYQEPKINRKMILQAIKDGEDLTGIAHLEQGESLRIK